MRKKTYTLEELNKMMDRANENGGWLDLSSLTSIPEGFNPTVGGWLDLSSLTSIPEGFNPTVGGSLDLRGLTAKYIKLENGIYVPEKYLYADDILTHVKRTEKIGDYTLYVGKIPGQNVLFDGVNYAHCKTVQEGINDLAFKSAADRGAEQYRGVDKDAPMTLTEAAMMYRIITGACSQGTQRFIDSQGDTLKETYTVNEIIALTEGQYGGEAFRRFFEEE